MRRFTYFKFSVYVVLYLKMRDRFINGNFYLDLATGFYFYSKVCYRVFKGDQEDFEDGNDI